MVIFSAVRTRLSKPGSVKTSLTNSFPRVYLVLLVLLALFGYAYILAFPLLVILGALNIYNEIAVNETTDWLWVLAWLAISIIAGIVSYQGSRFKPVYPTGLTLIENKAPRLFEVVQQLRNHYKRPHIHRVVITSLYQVDIIKTPRWALPLWSYNTLVIGLPVLLSLSPKQFECMLARRIGQFSKRDNLVTNWLYQLRAIWKQYRLIYARQKGFAVEPLKRFFAIYSPFYKTVSARVARMDELKADSYAMELYNDEEVREMITVDSLCRWYLRNQFWPAIYKSAVTKTDSLPAPHAKMAAAVYNSMAGDNFAALLRKVATQSPSKKDTMPSLQSRINNIGHEKARAGKPSTEIAAAHYLGDSMKSVVFLIDKLWLKTYLQQRKRQAQQPAPAAQIQATNSQAG